MKCGGHRARRQPREAVLSRSSQSWSQSMAWRESIGYVGNTAPSRGTWTSDGLRAELHPFFLGSIPGGCSTIANARNQSALLSLVSLQNVVWRDAGLSAAVRDLCHVGAVGAALTFFTRGWASPAAPVGLLQVRAVALIPSRGRSCWPALRIPDAGAGEGSRHPGRLLRAGWACL